MTRMILVASWLVLAGVGTATAEDVSGDRYVISNVEGGILRVDRHTGEVSFCSGQSGQWSCSLVADDRDQMLGEINGLREENRRLHRRLPEADDMGGPVTKEEVDEAMDTIEYMMERFLDTAGRHMPQQVPPR